MAGQEMLKQPCSTSDLGQAPSNQSACWPFKRVCPIIVAQQNCGNRRSKQKPNCQASSSASCWVIPGLSYIPLTHWPTSFTHQFHPADSHFSSSLGRSPDSQLPLRGQDKGDPVTRGDSLPQPVLGQLGAGLNCASPGRPREQGRNPLSPKKSSLISK
ncbi:hypothetical protein PCASD_17548 [Puccinia coronata f. sp. avenae]|uniref:Uncharacterized protein n=1 Tax=Puccinia coronata f. sp. avenae TaxID=200324 RepID=A0A2N5U3W3_9BASI|nr:hypothetical protein PCASD_17548 [Puccinia coronata f. sp. avenae]